MEDRKKVSKRPRKLPLSTSKALFHTFSGIRCNSNPPPRHPPKKKLPITNFLHEWTLPPPINKFNQSLHRYHRLWAETINELDHGFGPEMYEASYVEGYFWSAMEKRRFFTALDICGPQDPAAIQQRIGPTKTVYQVQLYISLLQHASDENPVSEDTRSTVENYKHPFAYEMSPAWVVFEEQQAQYLSMILDNEAISLNEHHQSDNKLYPPEMLLTKLALDQELYSAQEFIDPTALYHWSTMNPIDGRVPPTMTMEAQTVLYRITRKFVMDVMTHVILKHRGHQRQYLQRIQQQQQNIAAGDYSAKLEIIDDNCDIFDTDIEAALRDYYVDTDMDMTIKHDLSEMKTSGSDNEQDTGSERGDDDDLGSFVGENSNGSSLDSDSDTNSQVDSNADDDAKLEDGLDGSVYQDSASESDSGQIKNDDDNGNDDNDDDDDDDDDDEGLSIMEKQDRVYEAELYHQITF